MLHNAGTGAASHHLLSIQKAKPSQLLRICQIDEKQVGSRARRDFIENAIRAHNCLVAEVDREIVGFAITDQTFYGQTFIWLLIVTPEHRRQGVATELIRVIELKCPTRKLFTSTNSSNAIMQQLLDKLGFVPSGRIDNLDEHDPELVYFKRVSMNRTRSQNFFVAFRRHLISVGSGDTRSIRPCSPSFWQGRRGILVGPSLSEA